MMLMDLNAPTITQRIPDAELRQLLETTLSPRGLRLDMPRDPSRLWPVIRRLSDAGGGVFRLSDLARFADHLDDGVLEDYLARLRRGGFIAPVSRRSEPLAWRVIQLQAEAPHLRCDGRPLQQARLRDQMWRALKMTGWVAPKDLAIWASTDEATVSLSAALNYLGYLKSAGLVITREGGSGTLYRLKPGRHGPAAPRVMRAMFVWDENRSLVAGRRICVTDEVRL